jgi:hypothetical protein
VFDEIMNFWLCPDMKHQLNKAILSVKHWPDNAAAPLTTTKYRENQNGAKHEFSMAT